MTNMNYTVTDHDMGYSFIVHFEDDTYALVDTRHEEVYRDEAEVLMSQGYWVMVEEQPVSEEDIAKIDEVLKKAAN